MRQWILAQGWATEAELDNIAEEAKKKVRQAAKDAWEAFNAPIKLRLQEALSLLENLAQESPKGQAVAAVKDKLKNAINPIQKDVVKHVRQALQACKGEQSPAKQALELWLKEQINWGIQTYTTHLYSETALSATNVPEIKPQYAEAAPTLNGFEVLNQLFDRLFEQHPQVFAFGEDVGKIGDVNQGFMNMQAKYGEHRIFDTGIREWTIIGQAIGMAMRGLRPIAEIQYLDYLIYALSPLSDDLATVRYRSNGQQKAPAIIRTRGHRLEGIWHSGSPISMLLGSLRGVCVLVPRDMTRAAGFYNTMLRSDDPALIIECLNGYRLKEKLPDNLTEFTVPVGVVETLHSGTDVTLVTYGSCVRIAQEAIEQLQAVGISVELIDVQSLLPFDLKHDIVKSLQKTNRLVVLDEDVPGGASAYILQKILVEQKGYYHLDAEPLTVSAQAVRPAYGSDADYYIKPSAEDVFDAVYSLMHDAKPKKYPS
jgi:pyruvate/2-oxoglutarate/acetoin dehydrogenase E1 component